MSSVIEKEALQFARFYSQDAISIKIAKNELDKKLLNIKVDRHKLDFLNILRGEVNKLAKEHKAKCNNLNCKMDRNYDTALFAIDQELESISTYYTPQLSEENRFTTEERSEIFFKINEVLQKLEELGIGQQVVFEEIDSLKERLDLGKKDWMQLFKGKLFDLGSQNILEKGLIPMVYKTIAGSLDAGFFVLPQ